MRSTEVTSSFSAWDLRQNNKIKRRISIFEEEIDEKRKFGTGKKWRRGGCLRNIK
jgi:hypothetical protein